MRFIISFFLLVSISSLSLAEQQSTSLCDNSFVQIKNYSNEDLFIDAVQTNPGSRLENLSSNQKLPAKHELTAHAYPNALTKKFEGTIQVHFKSGTSLLLSYHFIDKGYVCNAGTGYSTNGTLRGWDMTYKPGKPGEVVFSKYAEEDFNGFHIGPSLEQTA